MSELSAKFKLVDDMSDKMAEIASQGQDMIDSWQSAADAANDAFSSVDSTASNTASAADGIATSLDQLSGSTSDASASASDLAGSLSSYDDAAQSASDSTDYWTEALGNYNTDALEAVYTTEELVEMGLKSEEALNAQTEAMELCQTSQENLSAAMEAATGISDDLNESLSSAAEISEAIAESDEISAETKENVAQAYSEAEEALDALNTAQQEASDAMEYYNSVMESGTTDLDALEAAAEAAQLAAENLEQANADAAEATDKLSEAASDASEELEDTGETGQSSIEAIASALEAAGITTAIKDITENVYEMATAFSDAESTVVLATGATGDTLDSLTESMNEAYAASKTGSLSDTASAVGEINTRLGYTGDELTETTELFLDFAAATGGDAASSVRSVTQLMNQWNVAESDMAITMDKLTYAGQASGISVDSLTSYLTNNKAVLDQLGFSLDESIAMFSEFELSGTNASSVMTGFRTALSSGAIESLEDLYEIFDDIASGEMSAADAADIFGTRAGTTIVNAVNNGVFALDDFVEALEDSEGTLDTTATAAQTLDEKWSQATNNIQTAFSEQLSPTIEDLSSGAADVANGIGTFLNEHPQVTAAITAIGTGVGTVAAAISGAVLVINVAIPAITAFGTAINSALGPVGWIAIAIAGLTTAFVTYNTLTADTTDYTDNLTAATSAQYAELETLTADYEAACEQYGASSEEASALKYQIDDLTSYLDSNGQTIGELITEVENLVTEHDSLMQSYDDTYASIENENLQNLALIEKLNDLATSSNGTAASQSAMQSIIDELNESMGDLNLTYEDLVENQDATIESLRNLATAEAEQQKQQAMWEEYVDLISQAAEQEAELQKNNDEVAAAQDAAAEAEDAYMEKWNTYTANGQNAMGGIALMWSDEKNAADETAEALDVLTELQEELQTANDETTARIAELEDELGLLADTTDEVTEETMTYEEAAATAYQSVQSEIEELCAAYDEAYQSALSSFQGQFGLFDEAATDSETYMNATVDNAQSAMDTQLSYWSDYNANLETLTAYGETLSGDAKENYEALLEYASDGSEEAAGLADSMAQAIEDGDTDAIDNLAQTVADVASQQEQAAATTADFVTDFSGQMDDLVTTAEDAIDDMDLSTEATAAAKSTIESYASQILASKSSAVTAAQSVADAVTAALQSANTTVSISTSTSSVGYTTGTTNSVANYVAGENGHELIVAGHANGTLNGENAYMAGENGPELIVNQPGSTVFPTSETDRLIDSLNNPSPLYVEPGSSSSQSSTSSGGGTVSDAVKRIILEIAGSGSIEVNGSADESTILELLQDNLKPILMSIIKQEIYEEGDLSYEY